MWVYWLILFWSVCMCADPICHPGLLRAVPWLPSKSHLLSSLPDDRKTRQGDVSLPVDDFWAQNSWLSRAFTAPSGSAAGNPPPCRIYETSNSLGLIFGGGLGITVLDHCSGTERLCSLKQAPVVLSQGDPSPRVEEQGWAGGNLLIPLGEGLIPASAGG